MAVAVITTLLGNQGDPVEYTVDSATAIPKGTLMNLHASPQTATAADTDGDYFVGIAAVEKSATNTSVVKMACITHCIAEFTAGTGATTFGQPQKVNAANAVIDADDDTVAKRAEIVCIALETADDAARFAGLVNC